MEPITAQMSNASLTGLLVFIAIIVLVSVLTYDPWKGHIK
jgi:hypothetical protein